MTIGDLIALVRVRIEHCERYPEIAHIEARVPLMMPVPKSWKRRPFWRNRVRTPFGMCEAWPGNSGKTLLIYPTIDQVTRWIGKQLKAPGATP